MLIAIICISDVNRSDIIDLKLEALFDLVDFSNSGTINMDELVRISSFFLFFFLLCILMI